MAARHPPDSVVEACASGDHRRALEALRDSLARSIEDADANVVPQVAAQLRATLTQLAELGRAGRESTVDDIIDEPAVGETNVVPLADRWGGKPEARKGAGSRRNSRVGA